MVEVIIFWHSTSAPRMLATTVKHYFFCRYPFSSERVLVTTVSFILTFLLEVVVVLASISLYIKENNTEKGS